VVLPVREELDFWNTIYIVAYLLKTRIVKPAQAAVARERSVIIT
jgi:hypothetical protein